MLLNDVYIKGEWPCDDPNKKRLVEILQAFPKDEPTRKRFISEAVSWSSRFGDIERGDPDIHHEAGKLYAEGMSDSVSFSYRGNIVVCCCGLTLIPQ